MKNTTINIWPYIELALILKNKKRKGFGNMFRHQLETFGILVEYGHIDPVILKASLIHDLIEDGGELGFDFYHKVSKIGPDGGAVYSLVKEVTRRIENGIEETKETFLERIMTTGSENARILKLADRLANINSLSNTKNKDFINRYLIETHNCILPYANKIDKYIAKELRYSLSKLDIRP